MKMLLHILCWCEVLDTTKNNKMSLENILSISFFILFLGIATSHHCSLAYTDCPLPFLKLGHKMYYFHTASKETWNDAFHWCKNNRLQLLSIDDNIEDTMISRAISDTEMYWTAGNDFEVEGSFVWRTSG